MTANVETMFYAGETPWHGLGTYVGETPITSEEALVASGLDWEVEKWPLFLADGKEVSSHRAMVRQKDEAVLGVVGKDYGILQNRVAFSILDELVRDGSVRYHTAGSLAGGRQVWLLAQVSSFVVGKDDRVDQFLFSWNRHDGLGAAKAFFTSVRVVCANTAKAALMANAARDNRGLYLRHTSQIEARATSEESRRILGLAVSAFASERAFSEALSRCVMTAWMWNRIVAFLFPDPKNEEEEKVSTRIKNKREELTRLLLEGRGAEDTHSYSSLWGARCAVVEYVNYHKSIRGSSEQTLTDKRLESSLFGHSAELVKRCDYALEYVLQHGVVPVAGQGVIASEASVE